MLAGGVALKMQMMGASWREERACLKALTGQGNAAGLLQQREALLELQVAEAGKALLGSGLPAAQMDCTVLKAICALVSVS